MVELVDFSKCSRNIRFYGGASGQKYGIELNGEEYILKFPQNTKNYTLAFPTSYSNNAFSEYIGSNFYRFMEIPVHDTVLGIMGKHYVVACKDFCENKFSLYEFSKIANAFVEGDELPSPSNISSDRGIVLKDILSVINGVSQLESIRKDLEKRFWDMFVVDALIANPDRNSGNWGILVPVNDKRISSAEIAPVFDNGNSLNAKLSDEAIEACLKKGSKERAETYLKTASIFQIEDSNGNMHKINPYSFFMSQSNIDCTSAILRLENKIPIAIEKIYALIDEISVLSHARKEFYKESIEIRYRLGYLPALKSIHDRLESVK